jgi:Uma2 family endonuclease
MVAEQRKPFISPDEYIALERTAEYRSEYWNGEIVAMGGGTRNHNRIVRNLPRRLGNQLEESACEPFASETRVRVPGCNTYFYPDVQIVCGEAHDEDTEAETLLNPTVIIEVLCGNGGRRPGPQVRLLSHPTVSALLCSHRA